MPRAQTILTSPTTAAFDYTMAVWSVANNICENVSLVAHVDMNLVAVDFVRCRNNAGHGTLATMTPLREDASSATAVAADFKTGCEHPETVADSLQLNFRERLAFDATGRPVVYLLSVYLPRFTSLSYREKLVTIAHELWHISERCDGRLRRFPGRCSIHGNSEKEFDATAELIIDRWLRTNPPTNLACFLKLNLDQLVRRHGSVVGQRFSNS